MARAVPKIGEAGYERKALDTYWTEPRATRAVIPHLRRDGTLWESACGRGDMVAVFKEEGFEVWPSDIAKHGCPGQVATWDFFKFDRVIEPTVRIVASNPPYEYHEAFAAHAIKLMEPVQGQVALLLRVEFFSAKSRRHLFEAPAPFSKLVLLTFRPRWSDTRGPSPRHNFAWAIWDWKHQGPPTVHWAPQLPGGAA